MAHRLPQLTEARPAACPPAVRWVRGAAAGGGRRVWSLTDAARPGGAALREALVYAAPYLSPERGRVESGVLAFERRRDAREMHAWLSARLSEAADSERGGEAGRVLMRALRPREVALADLRWAGAAVGRSVVVVLAGGLQAPAWGAIEAELHAPGPACRREAEDGC
jgi:hypothetical protein